MKPPFDHYEALRARDPRFDGYFFVAVRTTGIYCRSICPARTPLRRSCLFVETAAAAEQAGFRPCLRCRPELAPGRPAASMEEALFTAIRARALEGDSVEAMAEHAGYSARQLRRLMKQGFGVTPVEIRQTERLLFAKKLLQETTLPITEVSLSAGFASLRRFHALFRERYGLSPTVLRRERADSGKFIPEELCLRLVYRPPLAWTELLEYLARRAVPGVEVVLKEEGSYARTVTSGSLAGWVKVQPARAADWLEVRLPASLAPQAWPLLSHLRALLDLDANPAAVDALLGNDALLGPSVGRHPGLRVPGAWSTFELAIRAILGQQVGVAGASTLAGRLAARFGQSVVTPICGLHRLPPTPKAVASAAVAEIAEIGVPRARAKALRELAKAALRGELDFSPGTTMEQAVTALREIPGIGAWTAQYVAVRGLRYPDAFPAGDLGVRKALAESGCSGGLRLRHPAAKAAVRTAPSLPSEKEVLARAEAWRPWRAYAVLHLWQTLHDTNPH